MMSRKDWKKIGSPGGGLKQFLDACCQCNVYFTIYILHTMIVSGFSCGHAIHHLTYTNCIYNGYVHTGKNPKRFQEFYII